jgi:hypothetical protein
MAAQASITTIKTFDYRGAAEEWSNTYHFGPGAPNTPTKWKALADAVIAAEKVPLQASHTIIRAYGHLAGVAARDWEYDYALHSASVAGQQTLSGGFYPAGDEAIWVRWPTAVKSSKGKPIYLRSYMHGCIHKADTIPERDELLAAQKTAYETFGEAWVTGFSDGTDTYTRRGPNGAVGLTGVMASTWLTTRTLERRGKRR